MSTGGTTSMEQSVATQAAAPRSGTGEVPHFSLAERTARGKAARAEVPRSVHGATVLGAGDRLEVVVAVGGG